MYAAEEILARVDLYGPPTPSLLPWAARWAGGDDLLIVARTAAAQAALAPPTRWPTVADAVAETLARRASQWSEFWSQLVDILPPIASYFSALQISELAQEGMRVDALAYAELATHISLVRPEQVSGTAWQELLAVPRPLPPLANLRLLSRLGTGLAAEPVELLGSEVIYLLPYLGAEQRRDTWEDAAVAEIADYLPMAGWYAAALCARTVPFLATARLSRLCDYLDQAPSAWSDVMRGLIDTPGHPRQSAASELASAQPATPFLTRMENEANRVALATAAADIARRVSAEYGVPELARWQVSAEVLPDDDWYAPLPQPPIEAYWPATRQVPLDVVEEAEVGRSATASRLERHVNVILGRPGDDQPVPDDHVYSANADYELLLGIGQRARGSLLPGTESRFPDEQLPLGGVWLRAALALPTGSVPAVRSVFLPEQGDSFACDCPFGGEHEPGCARSRWARFPLPAARDGDLLTGELVIYYGAAAVVAISVRLSVDEPIATGATAGLLGRLSATFADLDALTGRAASIVASPSKDHLMVNGVSFLTGPVVIAAQQADTVARNARQALSEIHLRITRRGYVSLLDHSFGKSQEDYEKDVQRLAELGTNLYIRLFRPTGTVDDTPYLLSSLLRHEAEVRNRPSTLQIIDHTVGEHAVPWALVYDLPFAGGMRHLRCPSLQEFGPAGTPSADPPPRCPYSHDGYQSVLCPYGFWGLSCVIEQPVLHDPAAYVVSSDAEELSWLVITDPEFARGSTARVPGRQTVPAHVHVNQPDISSPEQLGEVLGPESTDVIYFYCHCGYETGHPEAATDQYLKIGPFTINSAHISVWARGWRYNGLWPHWPRRRPLVILNGCHTAEFTSGTLNDFPSAFVAWANAAGVIGTEISVEQGLASWVGTKLLSFLAEHFSVGEALHRMRWDLLRRGNVLGLAYTPFCLANLTLRPVVKE